MSKFKVGQEYYRPGLFGPGFYVKVLERTSDTVSVVEVGYEDDPPSEWTYLGIIVDTDGTEMCECWEYMGHKGYIRAS